jgi:hypothetical protein
MNIFYKIGITTLIGAIIGYSYYYFIGCNSGSCAITSRPLNSIVYGAFMGFVWYLPDLWKKKENN